jgi:hypothetical protein
LVVLIFRVDKNWQLVDSLLKKVYGLTLTESLSTLLCYLLIDDITHNAKYVWLLLRLCVALSSRPALHKGELVKLIALPEL